MSEEIKCPKCGTIMVQKGAQPVLGSLEVAGASSYLVCPNCGYAIKRS